MKRLLLNVGLAIAAFAAVLGALELGLRVVDYRAVEVGRPARLGRRLLNPNEPGLPYVYQSFGGFTHRWPSNSRGYFDDETNGLVYQINNYGFRDEDFERRRTSRLRIAFLGDSFCFGNGVRIEDLYATLVENALDEARPGGLPVEVYNVCLGSYTTEQESVLYDSVVRHFRPDVLVVWYFLNDVDTEKGIGTMTFMGGDDTWLPARRKSRLLDLVVSRVDRLMTSRRLVEHYGSRHREGSKGLASVERGLARMEAINRELGVRAFLTIFPILFRLDERYPFVEAHQTIAALAERHGFEVLDLLPAFLGQGDEELWVHVTDQHPNEIGHRIAGEATARFLAEALARDAEALHAAVAARQRATGHLPRREAVPPGWFGTLQSRAQRPAPPAP